MAESLKLFRDRLETDIPHLISHKDPGRRRSFMLRDEVERAGEASGVPKDRARREFFSLCGDVWAGWVIEGEGEKKRIDHASHEPPEWERVEFDVQWFQEQDKVPSPLP